MGLASGHASPYVPSLKEGQWALARGRASPLLPPPSPGAPEVHQEKRRASHLIYTGKPAYTQFHTNSIYIGSNFSQ